MKIDPTRSGLPLQPPHDAGPEAWRQYAAELEAIIAAGEHRAAFLQNRLNQIVTSPAWKVLKKARNILVSAKRSPRAKKGTALAPVQHSVRGQPLVSILIPFRDGVKWLETCLKSIRTKTAYPHYEFILIDNGSTEKATLRLLAHEAKKPGVKVVRIDEAFNYSRLNNLAAKQARGEYLLFLNNDVEALEPHWLEALLEQAQAHGVGAVGAKLLYPDGRIQHAGVAMGLDDIAAHVYRLLPEDDAATQIVRECSAVTGACLLTPRALFEELGGFNEIDLPVAYNDVDYCLRVREKNLRVLFTPYAKLTHHESVSRGVANDPRQSAYMCRRWAKAMHDPFYPLAASKKKQDDVDIAL